MSGQLSAISRILAIFLVLTGYALGTLSRNIVWSSDLKLWMDCLAKSPNKARPYRIYADTLKKENDPENAVLYYQSAMRLDPGSPLTYNNLGVILEGKGMLDQATSLYQKALSIWPDYPDALNNLGNICLKQGRIDEAVSYFTKAIELKRDPDYCYNLGSAYQRKERWDDAITWITRALALRDDLEYAHNNLGVSYLRKGLPDRALTEFKRALEIKPDFFDAHANLGLLYYNVFRDYQQALLHLNYALTVAPDHPQAGMIKGVVEGIQREGQRVKSQG
jgi:tetratricopeptide (TPR) repeat protein